MKSDEKRFSLKKQAAGGPVDPRITEALAARRKEGTLSCAEAFDIARNLDAPVLEVGKAMDQMEIKIVKCQLGLFGHRGGKRVKPDALPQAALPDALSPFRKTGRMPCSRAFEIARELSIGRPAVANSCEAIGIKITPCQLGAF